MSGLSSLKLRWMRTTGALPSTRKYENRLRTQEQVEVRCTEIMKSPDYQRLLAIRKMREDGVMDRTLDECENAIYKGSREESLLAEVKTLRRERPVRKKDEGSPAYKRYRELRDLVASEVFRERVAYLKDRRKYEKTEAGRAEAEERVLERSTDIRWLRKQMARGVVEDMQRNPVRFFDDFEGGNLNRKVWAPRFFWGDTQLGKSYSFVGDPHAYTDGGNILVQDGRMMIITRQEQANSLAWDEQRGFLPKTFDYTSGVVSTGSSLRMKRGEFEAKVRFTAQEGVYHAFYLVGDTRTPEIDVFRSQSGSQKKLDGVFIPSSQNDLRAEVGNLPFDREYFVLGVEITRDTVRWKINGVEYFTQRNTLPDRPMYMVFASGIKPEAAPQGESVLEIDWVRCRGAIA